MRLLSQRSALQRDHMIPLTGHGSNWPWSIQLLCAFHNSITVASASTLYLIAAWLFGRFV